MAEGKVAPAEKVEQSKETPTQRDGGTVALQAEYDNEMAKGSGVDDSKSNLSSFDDSDADSGESQLENTASDPAEAAKIALGNEAAEAIMAGEDSLADGKPENVEDVIDPTTGKLKVEAARVEGNPRALAGAPGSEERDVLNRAKEAGLVGDGTDPETGKKVTRLRDGNETLKTPEDGAAEDVELPQPDQNGDRTTEVEEGDKAGEPTTIEEASRRLRELTDGQMGDKNQESFDANLQKFLENPDLSDQQKIDTLNNLRKTIEAGDKSAREGIGVEGGISHDYLGTGSDLSANVRTVVAGAMDNAANPRSIDQGDSRQCNATTVSEQLYGQNPALATEKLNEVVTKAEFSGERSFDANGKAIENGGEFTAKVPPGIFKAAISESGNLDQAGNEVHNVADRLLKGGMINHVKQQYGQWFTERTDVSGTGERLYQMNPDGTFSGRNVTNGRGEIVQGPGADIHDVAGMANSAGVKDVAIMIGSGWVDHSRGKMDNLYEVNSAADIDRAMEGKVGGILGGNSGAQFFNGVRTVAGGGHVVSIYKGENGTYNVSDQYGTQRDRNGVSANVLADISMHPSEFGRRGTPGPRAAEEYGRRADGQSTKPGYNPATDRSDAEYNNSHVRYEGQRDGAAYYGPEGDAGVRNGNDKLVADPDQKAEEPKAEEPEEKELKKAEGETDTQGKLAGLRSELAQLQALQNQAQESLDRGMRDNVYAGAIAAIEAQISNLRSA